MRPPRSAASPSPNPVMLRMAPQTLARGSEWMRHVPSIPARHVSATSASARARSAPPCSRRYASSPVTPSSGAPPRHFFAHALILDFPLGGAFLDVLEPLANDLVHLFGSGLLGAQRRAHR